MTLYSILRWSDSFPSSSLSQSHVDIRSDLLAVFLYCLFFRFCAAVLVSFFSLKLQIDIADFGFFLFSVLNIRIYWTYINAIEGLFVHNLLICVKILLNFLKKSCKLISSNHFMLFISLFSAIMRWSKWVSFLVHGEDPQNDRKQALNVHISERSAVRKRDRAIHFCQKKTESINPSR